MDASKVIIREIQPKGLCCLEDFLYEALYQPTKRIWRLAKQFNKSIGNKKTKKFGFYKNKKRTFVYKNN